MPLQGTEATIADVVAVRAGHPDMPALSWYRDGRFQARYTYRDLCGKVAAATNGLIQRKVGANDRVVVLSNNCPEMYFLLAAIMSLGAIVAPLNPLESARVLESVLATLEPRLIIVGEGVGHDAQEMVKPRPCAAIDELFAEPSGQAFELGAAKVSGQTTAVILFTSGTTSEPKGVCLSHFNLLTNARGLYRIHNLAENPVHLCVLPLFHANAFGFSLVTSLFAGSHVVLCNGLPGYAVWSIIATEKVNIVSVVPQILQILGARAPSLPPPACLKYFVSAAAPLRRRVLSDFIAVTGVRVHQGYGLSECVNFATTVPGDISESTYEEAMFAERTPSIGTPLEGCDVFIRALQGSGAAPVGEEGEIVVVGATLMSGYWRNEAATRNAIVDSGLRTGDLGFYKMLQGQRFFFITGRIKEIIIRCGEKISPMSVEADLQGLHAFGRFAVAAFENTAAGEEIGLYLQLSETADRAGIAQVVNACPPLSRPRLVVVGYQEIPATPTGKVKRDVLGKRFAVFSDHVFGKEPMVVAEPLSAGRFELIESNPAKEDS